MIKVLGVQRMKMCCFPNKNSSNRTVIHIWWKGGALLLCLKRVQLCPRALHRPEQLLGHADRGLAWLLPKALDLSCNVWVNAGWYEGSWVPTLQPGQAHRWGGAVWHAVLTGTPWVTTAHAPALALKFRGEGIFRAVLAVLEDRCLRISSFPTTGRQVSACSANNLGPDPWHYTWPQGLTEQGTSCARGFVHSSQGHEPMFTPRVSTTSMALFLFF